MPEMPDVVTLTTITSDWGNDIRDRTVQRYSSVANRTTEHPTPSEGDLSYLEDSNTVWVYDGAAWVSVYPANPLLFEVDNYAETASAIVTGSLANVATVSVTIPATWASWKCSATATFLGNIAAGNSYNYRLTIDGTALQTLANASGPTSGVQIRPSSVVGYRTGMTTTGVRTIALQGAGGGSVSFTDIAIYARAVRLT